MNKERKEYLLNLFIKSAKEDSIKVTDVRWEDNTLMCTLYTSSYGILYNVQVRNYQEVFKLMHNGCKVIDVYKEEVELNEKDVEICRGVQRTNRRKVRA